MFDVHLLSEREKNTLTPLEQARLFQERDANRRLDFSFDQLLEFYSKYGWVFFCWRTFYMIREVNMFADVEKITNPLHRFQPEQINAYFVEQIAGDINYALDNTPPELRHLQWCCGLRAGNLKRYKIANLRHFNISNNEYRRTK